ncbi:MAG: DUF4236 domain-containing protein [Candidatus Binatus sp.]|uniref:DUF4236 domain-containing protein n=1 Tax=Candidatus Binatus sp. TaxID=2811406 RepID=UPI003BAEB6E8
MGNFRFYRRVSIFPGLSVNLSKSGPSLTVGMRGAHVTVGSKGIRKTIGIPGTGIYYTSHSGYYSGAHSAHVEQPISDSRQTTAHSIAQMIMLMCLIGAVAFAIAIVGSVAGGK